MEKNTKEPIKAELKDGKLIVDGRHEFNLEGLNELAHQADHLDFADSIDDIFYSYARICALFNYCEDREQFSLAMPSSESIFMLKVLRDSLKKM